MVGCCYIKNLPLIIFRILKQALRTYFQGGIRPDHNQVLNRLNIACPVAAQYAYLFNLVTKAVQIICRIVCLEIEEIRKSNYVGFQLTAWTQLQRF